MARRHDRSAYGPNGPVDPGPAAIGLRAARPGPVAAPFATRRVGAAA